MKQLVVIEHETHDRLVETYIDGELHLSIEPAPSAFNYASGGVVSGPFEPAPLRILPCEEPESFSDLPIALAVFGGTVVLLLVIAVLKFSGATL